VLTREEKGVATSWQVYQPKESKDCEEEEAHPSANSGLGRKKAVLLPLSAT